MESLGFLLYLVFTASWFLHLTARMPALGAVRFDLLLVVVIVILHFLSGTKRSYADNPCFKRLLFLIFAIIVATPFAEWPGSVLKFGIPNFIKAVVFFFFTIWFVTNEKRVKTFVFVFVLCQSLRVLEPLYLHVTQGYWGSVASMANWEYMERLSGAPSDIINPNGLAFVILTILPFLLVLFRQNTLWKIIALAIAPSSLYALYLTGSRSGMLGLIAIMVIFIHQSRNKLLITSVMVICGLIAASSMQGNFKDRYLSIVQSDTKNAPTAESRITGIIDDLKVGLRRPIFGHGLSTSTEANANFGTRAQVSHNIYTEIFQEIGIVGLAFFLMYILAILKSNYSLSRYSEDNNYFTSLSKAAFLFSGMNVFFGFASYGLSSYEWYFLGGLSIIIKSQLIETTVS